MEEKQFNYSPEMFAEDIRKSLYSKMKAKFFNLIESQVVEDKKVIACGNIVSDLANSIANDIQQFVLKELNNTVIKQEASCTNCKLKNGYSDCFKFKFDQEKINDCKKENYKHWIPREN